MRVRTWHSRLGFSRLGPSRGVRVQIRFLPAAVGGAGAGAAAALGAFRAGIPRIAGAIRVVVSRLFGRQGKLFGPGGRLNNNDFIRLGWSYYGRGAGFRPAIQVLRLVFGNKTLRLFGVNIHWHALRFWPMDIWTKLGISAAAGGAIYGGIKLTKWVIRRLRDGDVTSPAASGVVPCGP